MKARTKAVVVGVTYLAIGVAQIVGHAVVPEWMARRQARRLEQARVRFEESS